jgi:hypothetical protein
VLAEYLRDLRQEADLPLAVRYCAGLLFDPASAEGPLNTGSAIIRRALQELSGLSDAEYRIISRSQASCTRAVACRVWPGSSRAILAAATRRNSAYTSANNW